MTDPITQDIIDAKAAEAVSEPAGGARSPEGVPYPSLDSVVAQTVANDPGTLFVQDIDSRWRLAQYLHKSGMFRKKFDSEFQIIAVMLYGFELGLGPMQAMRNLAFFDGNFVMSADLMAGLAAHHAKVTYYPVARSSEEVILSFSRPGWDDVLVRWDMERAAKITYYVKGGGKKPLVEKDNWVNYPMEMLTARAKAEGSRLIAPDVLAGVYAREEMEDEEPRSMVADPETERLNKLVEEQTKALADSDGDPEERSELEAQLQASLALAKGE